MKTTTSKHNLKEKLKVANQYLQKLKSLSHEVDACPYLKSFRSLSLIKKIQILHTFLPLLKPQHALPDMFIWMISGNKRIAYQRVPAREIVYSIVEEERGKHCGKQQILLLRVSTVAI